MNFPVMTGNTPIAMFVESNTWTSASYHMSPFSGNMCSMVMDVKFICGSFLLLTAFVASQPVSKINNPKVTKPTIIIDRRSVLALYVLRRKEKEREEEQNTWRTQKRNEQMKQDINIRNGSNFFAKMIKYRKSYEIWNSMALPCSS